MAAVEALVEQLGWRLKASPAQSRLAGERDVLAEISHAALANAVEDLNARLSHASRKTDEIDAIGHGIRQISSLFELLAAAYRPAAPSRS